jgi:hypothetical protein
VGDLLSPQDRVRNNQAVLASVAKLVTEHYVIRVQGRGYLTVAGAQAVATAMGYTTAVESVKHVAPSDGMAGYWEAHATVLAGGAVIGRGVGCVFDDESPWNKRPQFARQMMAQTRATGRALKGVMGWATALLGTEGSFHEEMPPESPTTAPEPSAAPRRLAAPPKASGDSEGLPGPFQQVRGKCAGVEEKTSKAGKPYWRIGVEAGDQVEWFTSFKPIDTGFQGQLVTVELEPYRDGVKVKDVFIDVAEEVPF